MQSHITALFFMYFHFIMCICLYVLKLRTFSVSSYSYVLQLLNISKALTGKFIQIGKFSINGLLSRTSNNFHFSDV